MEDVAFVRLGVTDGRRDTGHRRPRQGGGNHVDDGLQRLEVDLDQCRRIRGCGFGLCDDERDRLPDEHDLGTGERLEPALRPVPRCGQIGRRQHRHDAWEIERCTHIDPPDPGVRIVARHDARVEEAGQAQVAPVSGGAQHLVQGVDARPTDPNVSRRFGHDGGLLDAESTALGGGQTTRRPREEPPRCCPGEGVRPAADLLPRFRVIYRVGLTDYPNPTYP